MSESISAVFPDVVDYYLTFLYRNELMDEAELPPVHIKKEPVVNPLLSSPSGAAGAGPAGLQMPSNPLLPNVPLKRTASEAGLNTEPPQMPIIPSGGQLPQTPLAPGAAAAAAASMEPKMKVSFRHRIASIKIRAISISSPLNHNKCTNYLIWSLGLEMPEYYHEDY